MGLAFWSVNAGLWVALLGMAGYLEHEHLRKDQPLRRKPGPLTVAITCGLFHHLLGWWPVTLFYKAMASRAGAPDDFMTLNLVMRPSATLFYQHAIVQLPGPSPWVLARSLPLNPTYMALANLDSFAVVGVLFLLLKVLSKRECLIRLEIDVPQRLPFGVIARWSGLAGGVLGGYHFLAQAQSLQKWGSVLPIELELTLLIPVAPLAMATPLVVAVSLLGLAISRWRVLASRVLVAALIFWGLVLAGIWAAHSMRLHAFRAVAGRSQPLIDAIHSYVELKGAQSLSPEGSTLQFLVPQFLSTIPKTGLGCCPDYLIQRFRSDDSWALLLRCPTGRSWPTELIYRPNGDFARYEPRPGSPPVPLGDNWAYAQW